MEFMRQVKHAQMVANKYLGQPGDKLYIGSSDDGTENPLFDSKGLTKEVDVSEYLRKPIISGDEQTLSEDLMKFRDTITSKMGKVDGKVMIVYTTNAVLNGVTSKTEDTVRKLKDEGWEVVFVISGDLGTGTRDMVLKLVGSPSRLVFLGGQGVVGDTILPNVIISKGIHRKC